MTQPNGNSWRNAAIGALGALLLLAMGWMGNGVINDHQRILDLEKRVAVLEAERKR